MSLITNIFSNLSLFSLCEKYHYYFFLFGMIIESDMLLITSGYFGGIQHMNIYILLFGGFFLTVFFNQLFFMIGKYYKKNIDNYIENHENNYFIKKVKIFYEYFNKYNVYVAVLFRFLFSIRLISPFILGTTSMTGKSFFIFNLIGGFFWSFAMIGGGFILSKYYSYEAAGKIFHYMPFFGISIMIFFFLKSYIGKKS